MLKYERPKHTPNCDCLTSISLKKKKKAWTWVCDINNAVIIHHSVFPKDCEISRSHSNTEPIKESNPLSVACYFKPVHLRRPCSFKVFTTMYLRHSNTKSTQISFPSSFSVQLSCFQTIGCWCYAPAYNDDIRTSFANNFLWTVVLLAKIIPCTKTQKSLLNMKMNETPQKTKHKTKKPIKSVCWKWI